MRIAVCDDERAVCDQITEWTQAYLREKRIPGTCETFCTYQQLQGREAEFDLFLLDYKMPSVDGLEIARALYAQYGERKTVIFITAYPEIVYDAFEVRTYRFLVKPVEKEKLYAALDAYMQRYRAQYYLTVLSDGRTEVIPLEDILYIEVMRAGESINTTDTIYGTLLKLRPGDTVELFTELIDSANNEYYGFKCWVNGTGNILGRSRILTLTVENENDEIYAVYAPIKEKYSILFSSSGNGTITYDPQAQIKEESEDCIVVFEGQDVTFSFVPDEGFVLSAILLDDEPQAVVNNQITLSDIHGNHTLYAEFNIHEHKYEENVTRNPTCTEEGAIVYCCSFCDNVYTETIPALGHAWDAGKVTKEPTCTATGVKTYTCQNDSSHTKTETLSAKGHDYKSVVTAPTCEERGYTTYTCANCGDSYKSDYASALGHNYGAWTDTGDKHERVCSRDGKKETADHSYGAWTVTKPANEQEEGEQTRTCTVCGHQNTEKIPKKNSELTLNKYVVTLNYKDSDTLTASEPVTWRSSDEKVVRVTDNGDIVTVGRGTATITATSVNSGKTAQCTVTVNYTVWQWLIIILLFGWIWY